MIGEAFKLDQIQVVEFGIRTKDKKFFSVPVDRGVQEYLESRLIANLRNTDALEGEWERYSVSEDYGSPKKLISPISDDLMAPLKALFEMKGLSDTHDILKNASNIDCYFAIFWDTSLAKIVAVRQAARFKGTLSPKGRFARLTDNTLSLVEGDVFRIEADFDIILDDTWVLIRNHRALEVLAELSTRVAQAAADNVQSISGRLPFVDLSKIEASISQHPRTARLVVAVSKRPDLDKVKIAEVERMAALQGIKLLKSDDGKIRPRTTEHHKFLEIFDDRRYVSRITGEDIPFIARSRIRTKK